MYSKVKILSTGSYLPENVIENSQLDQFPASAIPLIEQKTGVKSRRFADKSQCTSDLAINAGVRCLKKAQFDPRDLDVIVLATSSPDRIQPATATRVQAKMGASRAYAFDVNSVCSGGVFALHVADSLIKAGHCDNALVVASEVYSRHLNPADFSTYPYFGDGAGALLLSGGQNDNAGVIRTILRSDGSGHDVIQIPAGGTMLPFSEVKDRRDFYFRMRGKEVYQFVVSRGTEIINELIEVTGTSKDRIEFVIPHQANVNMIKELSRRLDIEYDRFFVNLDRYGNTAGASVLIALDELMASGKVGDGDAVILAAFGGGLSWAASLIRF